MKNFCCLFFVVLFLLALSCSSLSAHTFRWASDGDVNSMDPYTRNETFLLAFLQNIYEPLVRRNKNLKIEPALAERWERLDAKTWRFILRKGVVFHGGESFTADDVIFSYQRAIGPGSNISNFLHTIDLVKKVDDHTVDFYTKIPNPIFLDEISSWVMMSYKWADKNAALQAADLTKKIENFATRNANGTGPFLLVSREPDRKTILHRNPNWWDHPEHNLTIVEFNVIASDSLRVASLLKGDVDMVYAVSPQDISMLKQTPGIHVLQFPELRTLFLGFDQHRNELLYSNVKGKNPFKDVQVRRAIYQAIDIEWIHQKIMKKQSIPTGLLYGSGVNGYTKNSDIRYLYDPISAKETLKIAGYPEGFAVTLDCPKDRYINDEAICQAVSTMLAKIGIKVSLNIQTRASYFRQILGNNPPTSFYLLGWTPYTYDAYNVFFNLIGTRNGYRGNFNAGGYSDPTIDGIIDRIAVENDSSIRNNMIYSVSRMLRDQAVFVPLHQQNIVWAMHDHVTVQAFPDNAFFLRYVIIEK